MDLKLKRKTKFDDLSWLVVVSGALMLPPYVYWLWMLMPDSAFRLTFINGLMSESMVLWFVSMLLWNIIYKNNCLEEKDGKY